MTDKENYVLTALQRSLYLVELFYSIHDLAVHFENYVAASHADIICEGTGFHILHDDTFVGRNLQPVGDVSRHVLHRDAQLGFLRPQVFFTLIVVSETGSKQLGAICDRDRSLLLVVIADETKIYFRSRFAAGNIGNQFIAILYRLAIYGCNRVTDLETGLIRRATRYRRVTSR